MIKKILLTGGSGFIGRYLTAALLKLGCELAWLARKPSENINVQYIDITGAFEEGVLAFQPDVTIHLAAVFDGSDISNLIECNITLPVRILETLSKLEKKKRCFIYAGSYWQNGDFYNPHIPIDIYSSSKKSINSFVDYYSKYKSIKCIQLILFGTYGEKDNRGKLLDVLIEKARTGGEIKLSAGLQTLNLIHVSDACDAFVTAMDIVLARQEINKSYSVMSAKNFTIIELVDLIDEISGGKLNATLGALPYREIEVFKPVYNEAIIPMWVEKITVVKYIKENLGVNE